MLYFSPAQRRFDDYINDESAHPISGVLFVSIDFQRSADRLMPAPEGVLFVFRGKPSDISYNGKSMNAKGEFL